MAVRKRIKRSCLCSRTRATAPAAPPPLSCRTTAPPAGKRGHPQQPQEAKLATGRCLRFCGGVLSWQRYFWVRRFRRGALARSAFCQTLEIKLFTVGTHPGHTDGSVGPFRVNGVRSVVGNSHNQETTATFARWQLYHAAPVDLDQRGSCTTPDNLPANPLSRSSSYIAKPTRSTLSLGIVFVLVHAAAIVRYFNGIRHFLLWAHSLRAMVIEIATSSIIDYTFNLCSIR